MDKILRAIQRLIIAAALPGVSKVIYGDPQKIPEDDMPCVTVNPSGTNYTNRGTRYDQKEHVIEIRLIYNAKDIFNKPYDVATEPTVHAIQEAVKTTEIQNSDLETTAACIIGLIRKNQQLPDGGSKTCEGITVNSVAYQRTEERKFPAYEVIIGLTAVQVGNR